MENYEKIKSIGRGAYGTVYLCRRIPDGCLFIIKQIPVEEMSKDERQAAMNEVKVLAMLKHPNIIAYWDSFFEEKALMIVMEYAQGGTMYNFLEERKGRLLTFRRGRNHSTLRADCGGDASRSPKKYPSQRSENSEYPSKQDQKSRQDWRFWHFQDT